ncbi:MAG: hypothetical protein DHS20C01_15090 [marine bacterium B5-7]|nr:MAG: hypothetical protein DHS20C01_15090 [marine bacterium B5-7]
MGTRLSTICLVIIALLIHPPLWAQSFDDGVAAFESMDYERAAKIWEPLATSGHVLSQYNMGLLYEEGLGVPKDPDLSFFWYRLAALNGHDTAQYNLGGLYFRGIGVEQSIDQAIYWWRKSADAGNVDAMFNLGVVLSEYPGDAASRQMAAVRLKQAYDLGHPRAGAVLESLGVAPSEAGSLFFSPPPVTDFSSQTETANAANFRGLSAPPVVGATGGDRSGASFDGFPQDLGNFPDLVWVTDQPDDQYTVHIYPYFEDRVARFYKDKWSFGKPGAVIKSKDKFHVVVGSFDSRKVAESVLKQLLDKMPEIKYKSHKVDSFDEVKQLFEFPHE